MVLKYEPLRDAVRALRAPAAGRVRASSCSRRRAGRSTRRSRASLRRRRACCWSRGATKGIDERLRRRRGGATELSLGDYVLSGGELAAAVVIDAVARLLAGGARRRGLARRGFVHGRAARLPAVHAARGRRRPRRAGGAARRRSRGGPALAAEAGARADLAAGDRSCSRRGSSTAEESELLAEFEAEWSS